MEQRGEGWLTPHIPNAGILELGLAGTPEHIGGFPKVFFVILWREMLIKLTLSLSLLRLIIKAEMSLVLLLHNISETAPLELVSLSTPQFARMIAVLACAVSRPQNVLLSTPAAFCIETLSVLRCRAILYMKSGLDFRMIPSGAVQLRREGFVPSVLGAGGSTAGVQGKIVSAVELHDLAIRFSQHDQDQPGMHFFVFSTVFVVGS